MVEGLFKQNEQSKKCCGDYGVLAFFLLPFADTGTAQKISITP